MWEDKTIEGRPMRRRFFKVSLEAWMKAKPQDIEDINWYDIWTSIELPTRATVGSAGYDFKAPFGFTLARGESIIIPTGIKAFMQIDNELKVYPRSSLGFKYEMRIANTVPKIDADYFDNPKNEGHIFIKIINGNVDSLTINKGDAFCQGSFYEYLLTDDDSAFGVREGGIGSTDGR